MPHARDYQAVTNSSWNHPYTREQAAFPLPYLRRSKTWPGCARVDDTYGTTFYLLLMSPPHTRTHTLAHTLAYNNRCR